MIVPSPASVRHAAVVVSLEGAALVVVALTLAVRHLGGVEDQPWLSGYGTAGWFAIMGAAVLAAGWALWTGRRWGRGIAVFAQLLLLPVAWYMGVGSHQWLYAVPMALSWHWPHLPCCSARPRCSGWTLRIRRPVPTTPVRTPGR